MIILLHRYLITEDDDGSDDDNDDEPEVATVEVTKVAVANEKQISQPKKKVQQQLIAKETVSQVSGKDPEKKYSNSMKDAVKSECLICG
jgi:hypothetical protein